MKYVVTPTPESLADRKLIDCIRLLVVLGYANAAAHWYVGADAGRQELPEHEHILALALNLSAVGEAAVLFHKLVHDRVISQDPAWHGGVKEAWKFLHSPEVQSLRDKHLRFIRDKVSFHADPEPVMHYLTEAANAGTSVILWETTEHNRGGISASFSRSRCFLAYATDRQQSGQGSVDRTSVQRDLAGRSVGNQYDP